LDFSATTNYAVGDFVHNGGHVYRANKSIVAGAFNPIDWDTAPTSGEFEPPIAAGTTADYWRGDKSWQTLNKSAVGLGAVDNTSDANKPVSAATQTALNLKANLASPAFSGNPTAPTPAFPDNDTSIATTAFVSANFAPIMDPFFGGDPRAPTPATSDNDQSIATTAYVKANMAGLAPLASPAFTGNPTAPTAGPGDSDTSIATTAFVTNAVATGVGSIVPFPEAPIDGLTYGRKDAAWASVVGGAVVSDAAPAGPLQNGQLWWESDSGNTYIWVIDAGGAPGQWVQQNLAPPITIPANYVTATAQTRNRIVNGAMQISQELARVTQSTTGAYVADQWVVDWVGPTAAFTASEVDSSGLAYIRQYSNGVFSPVAASVCYARQPIEGVQTKDFLWGTASAKQVVLRFRARGTAGFIFSVALRNNANDRSFVSNFTCAVTNVWQDFTLVVPGCTSGTWPFDTTRAMNVTFCCMAGSNYITATPNTWVTTNSVAATGVDNLFTGAGLAFDITPGVRAGSVLSRTFAIDTNATVLRDSGRATLQSNAAGDCYAIDDILTLNARM
jgi:hypothetical protein